jgi:hypothetical protein
MKLIVVLGALVACLAQDSEASYTDEEKGFSIPIPKGWSVTRSADRTKYLVLRAPPEQRTGAMLILAIYDPMKAVNDGSISLDTFVDEVKKNYPKRYTDFEFVKAEKGKDGDNLTLFLQYRYFTGQKIGQLQYLVWTKTQHWSLSWGCLDEAFEKNRELFEKASKAFKPLPKK